MIAGESGNLARFVRKEIAPPPALRDSRDSAETVWFIAPAIERDGIRSCGSNRPQNGLHPQAVAEVGVDEPGLDAPILTNHERRRDRQQPAAIALKLLEIDTELPIGFLDLVAHPKHQAERERVEPEQRDPDERDDPPEVPDP